MKMKASTEDGSNLGLTAEGSLRIMLGGEAPKEEASRIRVRNRVLQAPEPMGKRPDRMSYEMCADAIIRAYLTLQEKGLTTPNATNDELWAAAKKQWPEFNRWLGGPSGYQVAWASNVFRWLNETPPQPNPAIMVTE